MKIIGLVGGTTWLSTIDYYRFLNQGINAKLGGGNSAKCILYSLNFEEIARNNASSAGIEANYVLILDACEKLKGIGAAGILLCANTMHLFADRLDAKLGIPVIHIAKATATEIKKKGLKKVGLLGTKFTMEMDFFKDKLQEQNIEALIPNEDDRKFIHTSIFEELGKDIFKPETKARYISIMDGLAKQGAEGIILGCTEIPLLIQPGDWKGPMFDTTEIHSKAAVEFSVS
jgi:aspartate racemase